MEVKVIKEAVSVKSEGPLWDGIRLVTIECDSSEMYVGLPAAIAFDGLEYGRTGWNSDSNEAYYRTDKKFATVLDK